MADPEDVARIRAYLKEHGTTYTRDALRARLLADGHPPQTVDLAFAQEYGLDVAGPPPMPPSSRGRVILVALGIFLLNYGGLPLLIGLFGQLVDASDAGTFFAGSIGFVVLTLAVESITAGVVRRRDPVLGRGLTWGVLLSLLPVVGGALLVGICLALITQIGG